MRIIMYWKIVLIKNIYTFQPKVLLTVQLMNAECFMFEIDLLLSFTESVYRHWNLNTQISIFW